MIKEILQEGFILKSKGYYKHAIEAFYRALTIDDSSIELFLEIAELYYLLGNEERALNYIEQVLNKDAAHIDSLKLLKRMFVNKQAWIEAEKTALNIYAISNSNEDLAEVLDFLNKQKKYSEVIEYQADEMDKEIIYQKAFAYFYAGSLDKAQEYINKALDLEKDSKLLLLKSKILFKKDLLEEALAVINEMPYEENNADYLNFAGLAKQYNFEFNESIKYFKQAIKISPNNDEYYYNCASTYFKMNDIAQAKKYYNLAISLSPDNPNYHFALANLYYAEKQYKRAFEELKYDFFESNLLKAIILYDTGYLALAKKMLLELESERPEDSILIKYKNRIEEELKI